MGNPASGGGGWWALSLNAAGTAITFETQANQPSDKVTHLTSSGLSWSTQDWHQIALTYGPAQATLYIDGVSVASGSGIATLHYPNATTRHTTGLSLGSNQDGHEQAKGSFDELETFNYLLSGSDIQSDFAVIQDPAATPFPFGLIRTPHGGSPAH